VIRVSEKADNTAQLCYILRAYMDIQVCVMSSLANLMSTNQLVGVSLATVALGAMSCATELPERSGEASSWSTAYPGKADIYGEDSRRELNDPSVSEEHRALSDSVAMVFQTPTLIDVTEDSVIFSTKHMSDKQQAVSGHPLCESEAFAKQISPGYCSAFLITPQLIATAGHCVNGHTRCEQMGFAFGYALERPDEVPNSVPRDQFYRCESLVGRVYNPFEEQDAIDAQEYWYDWAVIKLDRPVTDHKPVVLTPKDERLARSEGVVMIGHPSGLPMKVTEGSVVVDSKERYFNTNLDIYKGNSGSVVFGAEDGRAHGIAIRGSGGNSFELVSDGAGGQCNQSKVCEAVGSARGCFGNHVLRVDPLRVFTREDLKLIERHAVVSNDDSTGSRHSFTFDEEGTVDVATVHLNAGARDSRGLRVLLHHDGQSVEVMTHPKDLPYGRWTASTEAFAGSSVEGEWVIEVINETEERYYVEWAQVMLGHH